MLSRDSHAAPLDVPGLCELPITLDWFAHRKKVRLDRMEWGRTLAAQLESDASVGIMFHHAVMDAEEMQALAQLLSVLARHPNTECRTMQSLAAAYA